MKNVDANGATTGAARSRPTTWLTRFAPAPTGYLHLGHVSSALHVWNEARAHGGRVLLRIEDHDRERCRPEYEAALLDDLDWLGLVPDIYPTSAFRAGPCQSRQSDRGEVYAAMAEPLRARGLLYACGCSRKTLQHAGVGVRDLRARGWTRNQVLAAAGH